MVVMMMIIMMMVPGNEGCGWCLISCCFPWVALSIFRTAARDQYGIEVRPSRVTLCSNVTCYTCNANVMCHVFRVTSARTGPWVCCAAPASRARPPRSTRRGRQPGTRAGQSGG